MFIIQPQMPEIALQLIAAWIVHAHEGFTLSQRVCLLEQRLNLRQQPSLQMSWRLGWRMRGDLLLLPDPKQHMAEVMPNEQLVKCCSMFKEGKISPIIEAYVMHLTCVSTLHSAIGAAGSSGGSSIGGSSSGSGGSSAAISSPTLTAASLQLTSYLLLLAAARWQQTYQQLQQKHRTLLINEESAAAAAAAAGATGIVAAQAAAGRAIDCYRQQVQEAQDRLETDALVLLHSAKLLHWHILLLQQTGQWLPQLQQLPQQGRTVLLQALTLALHCSRLDEELQQMEVMELQAFLSLLSPLPSMLQGVFYGHKM
jgi:hypothetical protein